MKIFKYELSVKEKQTILLPSVHQIIRVDDVDGKFWLWAIVDPDSKEFEEVFLEFYKTGQEITTQLKDLKYIGFCKLFIMQELGLYVFQNISK